MFILGAKSSGSSDSSSGRQRAFLQFFDVFPENREYIACLTMGGKDEAFEVWLKNNELNEATRSVLKEQDLVVFTALSSLTESDLADLKITVGQRALLRAATKQLHPPTSAVPGQANPDTDGRSTGRRATLKTLAQDGDLNSLLKDIGDTSLTDLLATGSGGATVMAATANAKGSGERPARHSHISWCRSQRCR